MIDENMVPDPSDFDFQRQQLARRRKIAESMLARERPANGQMIGKFFVPAWGAMATDVGDRISANKELERLDAKESLLSANEAATQRQFIDSQPEAVQKLVPGLQVHGRRQTIAAQIGNELEAPARAQAAEAARTTRAEESELNRIEKGEQQAADRVARSDDIRLRATTPNVNVRVSGGAAGGSGGANPFAGAASQVGVDARDPNRAVYRIGKTGQVFSFDENGQPQSHEGLIAPKPATEKATTEAERTAAGYLGRMEAADQNLTNAPPLNFAKQQGMARAPSITNYALSEQEQKVYQQQADWVRAKLRKESGAVIGDQEMAAEIRTYFPQAGDSPAALASKAQSRAQAHEQMRSSAGKVKPTIAPATGSAPAAALDMLSKDPSLAPAFKAKYGYLPGGR